MKLSLISSGQLDREKFDECTKQSGNLFMKRWSLDALCNRWSALVLEDYEAVLALPHKTRYFIPYVYQAPFIPRISMGGRWSENAKQKAAAVLKKHFAIIHLDVDQGVLPIEWTTGIRKNYLLQLDGIYEDVYNASYSDECKRNLKKAISRGCNIEASEDWDGIIRLYHDVYGRLPGNHLKKGYLNAARFARTAYKQGNCKGYKIYANNGELLFGGIIITGEQRIYYWLGAPTAKGREHRVTYFFIDYLIHLFAGSGKTFDFEGSDIPGVAKFYAGFTRSYEEYATVQGGWLSSLI